MIDIIMIKELLYSGPAPEHTERVQGTHLLSTPPIRNDIFLGPDKAPKGTDTKVTSAKDLFCALPDPSYYYCYHYH